MKILEISNARYISDTIIDLDVLTEKYGIVPISVNMADNNTSDSITTCKEWINNNNNLIKPVDPAKLAQDVLNTKYNSISSAVQQLLENGAISAGYDSLLSVCSYSTSTGPFQPDGKSFIDWRDACWSKVISIQQEVLAGTRAEPAVDEVLALMPVRVI